MSRLIRTTGKSRFGCAGRSESRRYTFTDYGRLRVARHTPCTRLAVNPGHNVGAPGGCPAGSVAPRSTGMCVVATSSNTSHSAGLARHDSGR